jgi:hypothetical protein
MYFQAQFVSFPPVGFGADLTAQKERAGDNPALSPFKRKMVYRLRWSF